MPRLTIAEFRRQFRAVIGRRDGIVVVYSGIWTFGHRFDIPIARIAQALIEAMLEEMSSGQTLLLPAYTYAYTRTRQFSPRSSAPETGILPVTMLKHFNPVRSRSALNSFLAAGPRAHELAQIAGETRWGHGSLKSLLEAQHARMVVLGLPWKDACGFLHRIEEVCDVPYRYHKTFHGTWEERGHELPWSETMFVRPMALLPIFEWGRVDDLVRSRGGIVESAGEIFMESADAFDLVQAGIEILSGDKLALLTNREEINDWIRVGRESEIADLRRSEPRALSYFDLVRQ